MLRKTLIRWSFAWAIPLGAFALAGCEWEPFGKNTAGQTLVFSPSNDEVNKQCLAQLEKIAAKLNAIYKTSSLSADELNDTAQSTATLQAIDDVYRSVAELEAAQQLASIQSAARLDGEQCLYKIIQFRHRELKSPELYQVVSTLDASYFDTAVQHMINKWLMRMRHAGAHLSLDTSEQVQSLNAQLALSELYRMSGAIEYVDLERLRPTELLAQQTRQLFRISTLLGYPQPLSMVREGLIMPMPGEMENFIDNADVELQRYVDREQAWLNTIDLNPVQGGSVESLQLNNMSVNQLLGIHSEHPLYSWNATEWQKAIHMAFAQTLGLEFIPLIDIDGGYEVFYAGKALGQVTFHHLDEAVFRQRSSQVMVERFPINTSTDSQHADSLQMDSIEASYHVFLPVQMDHPITQSSWGALTTSYGELLHAMLVESPWWSNGFSDVDHALISVSRQWFEALISSYEFIQFGLERRVKKEGDLLNAFQQLQRVVRLSNALSVRENIDSAKLKAQWLSHNDLLALNAQLREDLSAMEGARVTSLLYCEPMCLSPVIGFFVTNQLVGNAIYAPSSAPAEGAVNQTLGASRKKIIQDFNQFVDVAIKPGSSRQPLDIINSFSQVDLQGHLH